MYEFSHFDTLTLANLSKKKSWQIFILDLHISWIDWSKYSCLIETSKTTQ